MRRVRSASVVAVTLALVATVWSPVSASVRHPIGVKGLWWGEIAGVAVDVRGDVYVTGSEGRKNEHMIVRRSTRGGGLVWQRTFRQQGQDRWTRGRDVAVGPDGTVYVAGVLTTPKSQGEFHEIATFLRAYGPAGALRWQRVFTIGGSWDPVPNAVAAGPGFVVMTGYTSCFECVEHEGWVRAWNPRGRLLWVDDFEFAGIDVAKRDMPNDVAVDRDGSIYVVGVVDRLENDYGGTAPSDSEVVIRRMTSAGGTVWTRVLSDRSKDSDLATSVAVRDGRVVVGALFGGGWGGRESPHPWVRVYSVHGRATWTRVWPGGQWHEDLAVVIGATGRVYAAWSSSVGVRVKALTAHGWLLWTSALDAEGSVDAVVSDGLLRLAADGPTCCHAKLYTYRA
jgi:hypothetical protein